MDPNQFSQKAKFVDLLNSQEETFFPFPEDSVPLSSFQLPVFGTQGTEASNYVEDTPADRRERRLWTPVDDVVLISAWLNTSKDPVVGNEKPSRTFWKRIAAYFAASPKVAGCEQREAGNCKQRWQKINDQVNKFCGSYEAATREKSSGQNENDILKRAHVIFFNNYKKIHLRTRLERATKRPEMMSEDDRPPGVKAAKSKKVEVEGKTLTEFQSMWDIKRQDLAMKERLKKMTRLDNLYCRSLAAAGEKGGSPR
ncbi:PREDICTED: glutathione S-transferase T3-like [Brassica oleracea var. oleracea]|uniref:glutathione S-transferase T3-like n=1 Tax=Brassica oleracea var. oleracea TaxID=109376 RepID=UPI0006A723C1|nr:PREDICTED: glutathione S-transferase T3-like [Brassica oleracea var. oleracea]